MNESLPHIVLLGRPNVGKSTLFNRLIRSNRAITHDRPGVTRDRMEGFVRHNGQPVFMLVDTGGLVDLDAQDPQGPEGIRGFEAAIHDQVRAALAKARAIAFVVDGRDGLLPLDAHLADLARRTGCPTLCVVNKVDGEELAAGAMADFHALGFPMIAVSAAHGFHIPDLLEALLGLVGETVTEHEQEKTEEKSEEEAGEKTVRIALLGRPNAGKSSLVNVLCGEERMIVSAIPGTTRDSVDVHAHIGGHDYVFVDTAGVRKKTKIDDPLERFSVNASIKSTTKADITIVALDGGEGLGTQDKRLIDLLDRRKTPFFIVVTKSDLLTVPERKRLQSDLTGQLSFCSHVPILFVSAKEHRGLKPILPLARNILKECSLRIPTGQMNRAMQEVLAAHQPPSVNRARPRFFYATQAETCPPTFIFFVSDATRVPESYMRYLERGLRLRFGLTHAPMRLHLRSSHTKGK